MSTYTTTDQLAEGQIVVNAGMRLLLTDRQIYSPEGIHGPVYRFTGIILNWDDITDPFIRAHAEHLDGGRTWAVQGNHLALWGVVEAKPFGVGSYRQAYRRAGGGQRT